MKGLTYEQVKEYFKDQGCTLLSTEYINNKSELNYMASCGHEEKKRFDNFKRAKYKYCTKCSGGKYGGNNSGNRKTMFNATRKIMETRIKNSMKYREDFTKLDEIILCLECNKTKPIYLFINDERNVSGKRKQCKKCSRKKTKEQTNNLPKDKMIKHLLKTCRQSSKRRLSKGRKCFSEFSITYDYILALDLKQNGNCLYTGRKLVWDTKKINKASIDRIDSSKGYVKGNIQLVTFEVNQAKNDLSDSVFLNIIKDIVKTRLTT